MDIVAALVLLGALQLLQTVLLLTGRTGHADRFSVEVLRFFPTVLTAYAVLLLAWRHGMRFRDLGFVRPRSWRPTVYAWAMAVLAGPGYAAVMTLLGRPVAGFAPGMLFPTTVSGGVQLSSAFAIVMLLIVVLAPVVEELIFRGLVFQGVRIRWPLVPAVLLVGLLFAAFHLDGPHFAPLFVVSAAFAYAYERGGSLWCSIVPHAGLNALWVAVAIFGK